MGTKMEGHKELKNKTEDRNEIRLLGLKVDSGTEEETDAQQNHNCCGVACKQCCGIFIKNVFGRSMQLLLYILDIATDISVAVADYRNGDVAFAGITMGLVFAPGLLFAVFAFMQVLYNNTGLLACIRAPFWILIFPLLPLWPVVRDLRQIYHGVLALFPANRQHHLDVLKKPSYAYLVKFLEAFTEAAPQILLRLYKITLRRQDKLFLDVDPLEYFQIIFSLVSLSSKIASTYQKNISTTHIVNGDMEDFERHKLPCSLQILALIWWLTFLLARFQAMALFAGYLGWWIFVVIGIHVVLVFLFQTISAGKDRVKRVFIYMFSAFVFIFAYLQFNMKTRMKGQAWFPYSIYSAIVFVENSVMIMVWFFIQMNSLPSDSSIIEQESQRMHWLYLTIFHYSAFFISIFFMILTFCVRTAPRDKDDIIAGTHIEVKTVPFKPGLPMRT